MSIEAEDNLITYEERKAQYKRLMPEIEVTLFELDPEARELWVAIGRRLLHGQKHYGGFKFGEYDLDQMAVEEIEDFIVYRMAKRLIKRE
jgi:hypothetical protein